MAQNDTIPIPRETLERWLTHTQNHAECRFQGGHHQNDGIEGEMRSFLALPSDAPHPWAWATGPCRVDVDDIPELVTRQEVHSIVKDALDVHCGISHQQGVTWTQVGKERE